MRVRLNRILDSEFVLSRRLPHPWRVAGTGARLHWRLGMRLAHEDEDSLWQEMWNRLSYLIGRGTNRRSESAELYTEKTFDGPFDLIVANILSRPLIAMAPALARHLAPGGVTILSGLLADQAAQVIAAHERHGLVLAHRDDLRGWTTLTMGSPA